MLLTNEPPGEQSVLVDAFICTVKLYVVAPIGLFVVGGLPGHSRAPKIDLAKNKVIQFSWAHGSGTYGAIFIANGYGETISTTSNGPD